MATVKLNNEQERIITGNDNIVIVQVITTIRGGRSLDVTGFAPKVINAGHVVIKETATGEYKPMPVTGSGTIEGLGNITAGSAYTDGTYPGVALTGGGGSGATANILIEDGKVTSAIIVNKGSGYAAGDTLSVSAGDVGGSGSGFSVPVAVVDTAASQYSSLPGGHEYAGILIATIPTDKAFAAILIRGTVNHAAAPFPMTSILSAVKTALPHILFQAD